MNPCFVHGQSFLLICIWTTAAATAATNGPRAVSITPIFAPTISARRFRSFGLFLSTKEFQAYIVHEENTDWVVALVLGLALSARGDKKQQELRQTAWQEQARIPNADNSRLIFVRTRRGILISILRRTIAAGKFSFFFPLDERVLLSTRERSFAFWS